MKTMNKFADPERTRTEFAALELAKFADPEMTKFAAALELAMAKFADPEMTKFAAPEGLMIGDENPKKEETNLPDLWFEHDHTKCIEEDQAPDWINFSLLDDDDDDVSPFFDVDDDDVLKTDSYTFPKPTETFLELFQKSQKHQIPVSPSRDRPLSPRAIVWSMSPIHSSPLESFEVLYDRYCKERKKKIKDMKKKLRKKKNKKNKKMNKKKRLMRKI